MNWKYILIVIILAAVVGGGILAYQYWWLPKEETKISEIEPPAVKAPEEVPPEEILEDETAGWKTYRNEKYGFEFQYPTRWKVDEDASIPFVQLQVIDEEGNVVAIAGGISIISKEAGSPYVEMFTSDSRCPDAAGSRDLSSPSQYEAYVYCLTGDEIEISAGTWKGAVECSASQWYGMKVDPSSCPHQFWIDTKDFFFVVHFNFFQPIEENSDEAMFFEKILKGFSFFAPSN